MSRPRKPGRSTKGCRDRLFRELQAKHKYASSQQAAVTVFDLIKWSLAREIALLNKTVATRIHEIRVIRTRLIHARV